VTAFTRSAARELMDDPVVSTRELEENMRDIERANRWFGGVAPLARECERLGARNLLDVGCGSADVPRALVAAARRKGVRLRITCLDRSEQMLDIARCRAGDDPDLTFVQADGTSLPFADAAFDAALCSLALHHFEPGDAPALLRELRRVSRLAPLVCDLRRSRVAFCATWLFTRLFTTNRLTRHDGPLSVRRAYTPREALSLAREAGWRRPVVRDEPWFRMTLMDAGAT
jgi:SAM-dependent methyltransferase